MIELQRFLRVQWDRATAIIAVIVGIIAILIGYWGVSGTSYVAAQLPYFVSGGLVGLFFLGLGGVAWISADLRDEWRELRSLRGSLDRIEGSMAGLDIPIATGLAPGHSNNTGRSEAVAAPVPASTSIAGADGEADLVAGSTEGKATVGRARPLRAKS
jgi:hypothetical protein